MKLLNLQMQLDDYLDKHIKRWHFGVLAAIYAIGFLAAEKYLPHWWWLPLVIISAYFGAGGWLGRHLPAKDKKVYRLTGKQFLVGFALFLVVLAIASIFLSKLDPRPFEFPNGPNSFEFDNGASLFIGTLVFIVFMAPIMTGVYLVARKFSNRKVANISKDKLFK